MKKVFSLFVLLIISLLLYTAVNASDFECVRTCTNEDVEIVQKEFGVGGLSFCCYGKVGTPVGEWWGYFWEEAIMPTATPTATPTACPGCLSDCTDNIIQKIAKDNGVPVENVDCCYGCWEFQNYSCFCRDKWTIKTPTPTPVFVSPLPVFSPLHIVQKTATPVQTAVPIGMPDWYYQPFGFPCEYLNPGNQNCICFHNAPMWCP